MSSLAPPNRMRQDVRAVFQNGHSGVEAHQTSFGADQRSTRRMARNRAGKMYQKGQRHPEESETIRG